MRRLDHGDRAAAPGREEPAPSQGPAGQQGLEGLFDRFVPPDDERTDGLLGGPRTAVSRWWRHRSLRARLVLTATSVLALALAAAAVLLLNSLRISLTRGLDDSARQSAQEVAALIDANRLPDPVPVAAGTITVQVLDGQGRIIDATPGTDRLVPLLPPPQAAAVAASRGAVLLAGPPYGLPGFQRVVAAAAGNHETVIAAVSYGELLDSIAAIEQALIIGVPLLLFLLAGVTWLVTGAALAPVAALRRGAAEITADASRPGSGAARGAAVALSRRLPVPSAKDEVRSLAVTLNDMLARLEVAQRRQRALVSDAAHELRSPIASIRAQLEVALDHPESQEWPETAEGALADTMRLSRLAEDLLMLARLDERSGRQPGGVAGQLIDLAELCDSAASRYAPVGVAVTAAAPAPCPVRGDRGALERMLSNLLDNAQRYARSSVTVAVHAADGWVTLTVTDDGPGIPAADAERVFERFTRLDQARSRGQDDGGAGLGLAIVRAVAAEHGGTAKLEDAAPGLRAVVRLPAAG